MKYCHLTSCYFRWACKMKKFRTKIPDLEFFLYGIHLFGGICDKLTWKLRGQWAAHRHSEDSDGRLRTNRCLYFCLCGERPPVPLFRRSVGTGDRNKLLCALLPPQRGHRWQEQASLYPSSASAWAQMTGASFSVPFFRLSVGTDDRSKLLCALKPRFGDYTQDLMITPRAMKTTGA